MAFADVVTTSSDPHLGAIRLSWWRERLEELDAGQTPAEPRLEAVSGALLARGVSGKELSELEDAWLPLLDPFPWQIEQAGALKLRGRIMFGVGVRLFGIESGKGRIAGELWSLVDGAHHCSDAQSRSLLLAEARNLLSETPGKLPLRVRPLTVLAALAAADLVNENKGLARLSAAIRHRLFGSLPRS